MGTNQSLSVIRCFRQSISLTFSNFFAFLGAAVLAWICSVVSLSLLFPSLMTGLENMYLRAKVGDRVKATDVFMHRRKWWSLYWDAVAIAWHVGWPLALFGIVFGVIWTAVLPTLNLTNPSSITIIMTSFIVAWFLMFLLTMYRESRHLHALNLSAEFGLRGADSRQLSRLSVKSRWKDTIFAILLAGVLVLYWAFDPILTPVGVLLLLPTMGATSMAFLHDLGEKQEILELIERHLEAYKRPLGVPENPCPTCGNSNVRRAYIEDGSHGDWCPDCNMSLQKMRGSI